MDSNGYFICVNRFCKSKNRLNDKQVKWKIYEFDKNDSIEYIDGTCMYCGWHNRVPVIYDTRGN